MEWLRVLIALVLLVVGATQLVSACSCVAPGTPLEELGKSDAVFTGVVAEIDEPWTLSGSKEVTFIVSESWKGVSDVRMSVYTPASSASCGVGFEEEKEYLVYATENEDGELYAYLCSRTALLENAQNDVIELAAISSRDGPVASLITLSESTSTGDSYDLVDVTQFNSEIEVDVTYGGGCEEHEFELRWDGSVGREVTMTLWHEDNGDRCEAYAMPVLRFDPAPLLDAYYNEHGELDPLFITVEGDGGEFTFQYVNPDYMPPMSDRVFCTQDVKECEDGSYVGRNPANDCAFDPCPEVQQGLVARIVDWFKGLF